MIAGAAGQTILDRFWWPGASTDGPRELWSVPKGADGALSWLPLRVSFSESLRPPWLRDEIVQVVIPMVKSPTPRGEVLVEGHGAQGRVALAVRTDRGIVFTFDLRAALEKLLFARAFTARRPLRTYLPFHYHRVPPRARALAARILVWSARRTRRGAVYPQWPLDPSVEFLRWLWYRSRCLDGHTIPPAAFWPGGRKYAVALTHDVDTEAGQQNIGRLAEVEEALGFRSCWYVVGRGYPLDNALLEALATAGHEIGLHGDSHDNTLAFAPAAVIDRRLRTCRDVIERWAMQGFRSPSLFRTPPLLQEVARRFNYDSSVPDTDSFPITGSGCGSVFPLSVGDLLVLPLTVPADGALLFEGRRPEDVLDVWDRKIRWIRAVGGMAVTLTHPEPHMSGRPDMVDAYRSFLRQLRADPEAWVALPKEIALHWRRREQGFAWNPISTM